MRRRVVGFAATVFEQGSQSIVNLALSVLAARILSVREFGAFSVVFVSLTVVWGGWRALYVEPFIVMTGARVQDISAGDARTLLSSVLKITVAPVALALLGSLLVDGIWRTSLVFLAIALPVIATLDVVRAVNIAARRAATSLRVGLTWMVSFLAFALYAVVSGAQFALVLAGYLLCASCVAAFGRPSLPSTSSRRAVLTRSKLLLEGKPLGFEFLLTASSVHMLLPVVAITSSLEESAGLRGAMVIAGPLTTLIGGARLAALADATGFRAAHEDDGWFRYAVKTTIALTLIAGVGFLMTTIVAYRFGGDLLGQTWERTDPALLPFLCGVVLTIPHLVAGSILRSRMQARSALCVRAVSLPFMVVPAMVGSSVAGARGAALGFMLGSFASIPIFAGMALRSGPATSGPRSCAGSSV